MVHIYPNTTRKDDGNTHNATTPLACSEAAQVVFFFLIEKKKLE